MAFTGSLTIKDAAETSVVATYTARDLVSAEMYLAESLSGEELSYDTASFVIDLANRYAGGAFLVTEGIFFVTEGMFLTRGSTWDGGAPMSFPYGYVVIFTDNGVQRKFYLSAVTRIGPSRFKLDCISAIGLLAAMNYNGGIWTQDAPTTVQDIIEDILDGSGLTFTYEPFYADQQVTGWIGICTKRQALQQVLFAMGLNLVHLATGEIQVTAIEAENPTVITDTAVYVGGSVGTPSGINKVVLLEHNFTVGTTVETIFDGLVTEDNFLIRFPAPYHDLVLTPASGSGITILESGVNYAILGLPGDPANAKLTGQIYIDSPAQFETTIDDGSTRVANVTDAYLINQFNSVNALERLARYYSTAVDNQMAVIFSGNERPGDYVTIRNAYNEIITGFISKIDVSYSGVNKAILSVLSNYIPTGSGNAFGRVDEITASGTWTVPSGVYHVKLVLIAGGEGGYAGGKGADGSNGHAVDDGWDLDYVVEDGRNYYGTWYSYRRAIMNSWRYPYYPPFCGSGGSGSSVNARGRDGDIAPGGGRGKILIQIIPVSPGDVLTIGIGAGGSKGLAQTPNSDYVLPTAGGDTTVSVNGATLTSADGASMTGEYGYVDPITQTGYAMLGDSGSRTKRVKGNGVSIDWPDSYQPYTEIWEESVPWGIQANMVSDQTHYFLRGGSVPALRYVMKTTSIGGGGGSSLSAGGNATPTRTGDGGDADDETVPGTDATVPGSGGNGGNAGWGGGNAGNYCTRANPAPASGTPGRGGYGSDGGNGASGATLIYY